MASLALVVEAAPFAYIGNQASQTVSVIDVASNSVVATINVAGSGPTAVSVSPDGNRVLASGGGVIRLIDAASNAVVSTTGGDLPFGVAFSPDSSVFYNAEFLQNKVSVRNASDGSLITDVIFPIGINSPRHIAVSPQGWAYVTSASGFVQLIEPITHNLGPLLPGFFDPQGIAISRDGSRVYVANSGNNTVLVLDATQGHAPVATVAVGNAPSGITVTPDGAKVYVANVFGGTVSVIDTSTNTVTATVSVGTQPQGVSTTPDGAFVYVNNQSSGNVSVISVASDTVVATVGVGSGPIGIGQFIVPAPAQAPPVPSVSLAILAPPATFSENGGTNSFSLLLSEGTLVPVVVNLVVSGTASLGVDYSLLGTSLTIPPFTPPVPFTFPITGIDDALFEGDESVILDIDSVTNGVENGVQQVTLTVLDDETSPAVSLSLSIPTLVEAGGTSTVTVTQGGLSALATTVVLSLGGTASTNIDYTASSLTLVIPAGNTTGSMTLTGIDDAIFEGPVGETVVVDIVSVTNGTENGTQQVVATIVDDEVPPAVSLSLSSPTLVEAGGTSTVTAMRGGLSALATTVVLNLSGTASTNVDYTASSLTLVIPAGSTSASMTLTGIDDAIFEGSAIETIVVDIVSVTNGTENGIQQVVATIIDDDTLSIPTLSWWMLLVLAGVVLLLGAGAIVSFSVDRIEKTEHAGPAF